MARPSVAAERREQIVEATMRCIAEHGYAGTTLEQIAQEAGMARGHVRHFVGNRDALMLEVARAFYGEGEDASFLPREVDSLPGALDFLFGELAVPNAANTVALALVEAAHDIPGVQEIVLGSYTATRDAIAALVVGGHPDQSAARCAEIAYGLLTMALGNVFMNDIAVSEERSRAARLSADALVATLR